MFLEGAKARAEPTSKQRTNNRDILSIVICTMCSRARDLLFFDLMMASLTSILWSRAAGNRCWKAFLGPICWPSSNSRCQNFAEMTYVRLAVNQTTVENRGCLQPQNSGDRVHCQINRSDRSSLLLRDACWQHVSKFLFVLLVLSSPPSSHRDALQRQQQNYSIARRLFLDITTLQK